MENFYYNENLLTKFVRKRRKHYELRLEQEENELPIFERKRRKILRDINPMKISIKNEFTIISAYLMIKNFPANYKFDEYWSNEELSFVQNLINLEKKNDQVKTINIKFFLN